MNNVTLRFGVIVCEVASFLTVVTALFAQMGSTEVGPALVVAISGLVTAIGGIIIGGGVPMLKIWLDERKDARHERMEARKLGEKTESNSIRISDLEKKSQTSLFALIVEMAPVAIIVVNNEGVIVMLNKHCENIFGYGPSELVGLSIPLLIPPRYRKNHAGFFRGFFENPSVRQMGEGRELFGMKKDGTEFPIEIALKPFESDTGMMVMAVIADITKRKEIEGS